jgi:hypothetical protein
MAVRPVKSWSRTSVILIGQLSIPGDSIIIIVVVIVVVVIVVVVVVVVVVDFDRRLEAFHNKRPSDF